MRLKLFACEVLFREFSDAVAKSPHRIDVEFVSKGLHDLGGPAMRRSIQQLIDRMDPHGYSAVLLGYALCGNGLSGLVARGIPLVAARAHDCIGLLLGSRSRYNEYFHSHPGTYFRSTGWIERGGAVEELAQLKTGAGFELAQLVEKYGEENGQYLYQELHRYRTNYRQLTFIETGLEPDRAFEDEARREALGRSWSFEKVSGSLRLFQGLVAGDWNPEDFLIVPPGHRVVARYDDRIIHAEPTEERASGSGSRQ